MNIEYYQLIANTDNIKFDSPLAESDHNLIIKAATKSLQESLKESLRKDFSGVKCFSGRNRFHIIKNNTYYFLLLKIRNIDNNILYFKKLQLVSYEVGSKSFSDFPKTEQDFINSIKKYEFLQLEENSIAEQHLEYPSISSKDYFGKYQTFLQKHHIPAEQISHLCTPLDKSFKVYAQRFEEFTSQYLNPINIYDVLSGVFFIRKILEQDTLQTANLATAVQELDLGALLNQCVNFTSYIVENTHDYRVNELVEQVNETVLKFMHAIAYHYFHTLHTSNEVSLLTHHDNVDTTEWYAFQQAVKEAPKEKKFNLHGYSFVMAKDEEEGNLWLARSSKVHYIPKKNLNFWNENKKYWQKKFPQEKLIFSKLFIDKITIRILEKFFEIYQAKCRLNNTTYLITRLESIDKSYHDFFQILSYMMNGHKEPYKIEILKKIHFIFPNIFSETQWQHLEHLSKTTIPTKKDIKIGQVSAKTAIALFLFINTCGETKIALECCRQLAHFTSEKKKNLPPTLSERLQIVAFNVKDIENRQQPHRINICQKCHQGWPVFEALYWTIHTTDVDLKNFEHLNASANKKLPGKQN